MFLDGEMSELDVTYSNACSSLGFGELGIKPISLFTIGRNSKGELHNPTVTPSSYRCACGCKRLWYEFKPVVILHVQLTKGISQETLMKAAVRLIEHTDMTGAQPLHVLHVESGLEHVTPMTQYAYFPVVNLITGAYE